MGGQVIGAGEGQGPFLSIMNYSPTPPAQSPGEPNRLQWDRPSASPFPQLPLSGDLCHPLGPISRVVCSFVLLLPAAEHTSTLAVTQR